MKHTNMQRTIAYVLVTLGLSIGFMLAGCTNQPLGTSTPQGMNDTESASSDTYRSGSEASYGAPVLGIIVDAQGRIIAVEDGGAAHKAGVQVGDVLAEIAGMPLTPALRAATLEPTLVYGKEVRAIRSRISEGKVMKLVLQRAGRVVAIDLQPGNPPIREGLPTPTAVPQNELYM